jgi:hypothetical protein
MELKLTMLSWTIKIIITLFGIVRSNFAVPKKKLDFEIKQALF